jgi:hypothetical protein
MQSDHWIVGESRPQLAYHFFEVRGLPVALIANNHPAGAAAKHFPGFPGAFEIKPAQLVGRRLTARTC